MRRTCGLHLGGNYGYQGAISADRRIWRATFRLGELYNRLNKLFRRFTNPCTALYE